MIHLHTVHSQFYLVHSQSVVVKIAFIGTRTQIVTLESGALPACLFPAWTLISCRAAYIRTRRTVSVHCAHCIPLHISIQVIILNRNCLNP